MKKVLLSWSSGKDSAWALHLLKQQPGIHVAALFTTFNSAADRVAMHAVRRALVHEQAHAVGLPLWNVELPWPCTNVEYESRLSAVLARAREEGFHAIAFGDLFLEDIRAYRIKQLEGSGLEPLFPLWGLPTDQLSREMVASGVKAKITCVDKSKLESSFAGRDWDADLLQAMPPAVDSCGENGEFHTFVFESPVFAHPLSIRTGERVERDGFGFIDLLQD